MSVVSRVMWHADVNGMDTGAVIDEALLAISPWARDDDGELLPEGTLEFERVRGNNPGDRRIVTRRGPDCLTVELIDRIPAGDEWGVEISVKVEEGRVYCLVDNTLQSPDPNKPVSVGRPAVVDSLLEIGSKPKLGDSGLLAEIVEVSSNAAVPIAEHIQSESRILPVVVATHPRNGLTPARSGQLARMAKRITGMATVVLLDSSAQDVFREQMPERMSVWGGAIRVYVAGNLDSPYRHRLFTDSLLESRGLDPVVNWTTHLSPRRLPPAPVRNLIKLLSVEPREEHLEYRDSDGLPAQSELEAELDYLRLELAESESMVNTLQGIVDRLKKAGFEQGKALEVEAALDPESAQIPDEADGVENAVHLAQIHLEALAIPMEALREIDKLDTAQNSMAWGNTMWRGLRALNDYALDKQDGFEGGFFEWCRQEGRWTASPKKLAMKESETVRNNPKYWNARSFPCATELDGSGYLHMEAHLKISEGGGDLAPRVYFHDDSLGMTRKIHVGFIGPHYLVPNTKS